MHPSKNKNNSEAGRKCTTGWGNRQWRWGAGAHTVALLGLVMLAGLGISLESSGGVLWLMQQVPETGGQAAYEPSVRVVGLGGVMSSPSAEVSWALQWPASAFEELVPNV